VSSVCVIFGAIFCVIDLLNNLRMYILNFSQLDSKMSKLQTNHPARNLGFISEEHLTFSDPISSLSKSCHLLVVIVVM